MTVRRDPKTFYFSFYWPKDVDENLKHENEFIIKSNESLAENKMKNEIEQLLSKYKYGNNIHEHGQQQNEWANKFALNFSQRLDLKSTDKNVTFQNLSTYYTLKNIRKELKIIKE